MQKKKKKYQTPENQHNHGLRRDNSSGFPGVSWHKRSKKYIAQIFLVYQLAKIKFHPTNPTIQQLSPEGILQSKIINNEKGLNFE